MAINLINTLDGTPLLSFTTTMSNDYQGQSNVAFEPLERGGFSSDSKQATPNEISVMAVQSGALLNRQQVESVLNDLQSNTTLLAINLYLKVYAPYTLKSFTYHIDTTQTALYANLTFREVRLTTPQYSTQNYKNPLHRQQIKRGIQQGKVLGNSEQSIFFNWWGKL